MVHRPRGTTVYFHQAIHEKRIRAIPGIHYFDAHRLQAQLLNASELQLHPELATFQDQREQAMQLMTPLLKKNLRPQMRKMPTLRCHRTKNLGVHQFKIHQLIPHRKSYWAQLRNWKQWWLGCKPTPTSSLHPQA